MVHHVLIMSVNPASAARSLSPFRWTRSAAWRPCASELGLQFKIEVDGGVAHDTVASIVQAGAELLVAGNAVFGAGEPERDARALLAAAREADGKRDAAGKSKIH